LKNPLHLAYAIPDHPWIDSADGAAVRIAMTVAAPGHSEGILAKVTSEHARDDGENEVVMVKTGGVIAANLQIGADVSLCKGLASNDNLSNRGFCLFGAGFIVSTEVAEILQQPSIAGASPIIWNYRNGKDLTNRPRGVKVIDAFPFSLNQLQSQHPGVYQHLLVHVKPERDHNSREGRKNLWWAFGEPNKKLRNQLAALPRYIATVETSKHRFFTFLGQKILPDNMLIAIASDDAFILGILSSHIHVTWALAAGGRLGMGNDPRYNKSRCFEPFPFPALKEGELKQHIRDLGEQLDAHRKRQQELYPDLTLTGIYNVLEKLRSGEALTAKDKEIHDKGLVSVLKQIHDDLDAAVLDAYGWSDLKESPHSCGAATRMEDGENQHGDPSAALSLPRQECRDSLFEQQLLTRLVALNHERAAEEKRGLVRWLRPDYQAPGTAAAQQTEIGLSDDDSTPDTAAASVTLDWPAELPAQVVAISKLLPTVGQDPEALAGCFGRKSKKRTDQITAILATLKALGHID
jgi:hypothetical protein